MKYLVAPLPKKLTEKEMLRARMDGYAQDDGILTKDEAVRVATDLSRSKQASVGIYVLAFKVNPPDVIIEEVKE